MKPLNIGDFQGQQVYLPEGRGISLDLTMLKQQTWWFLIGYPNILCFSMDNMDGSWLVDDGGFTQFFQEFNPTNPGNGNSRSQPGCQSARLSWQIQLGNGKGSGYV